MYLQNVHRQITSRLILKLLFASALFSGMAQAEIRLGLDVGTLQENRSGGDLASLGRTLVDGYFGLTFRNSIPLYLNLGYLYLDSVENYRDESFTTITAQQPYVGLSYIFWPKGNLSLGVSLSYTPFLTATRAEAGGSEDWEGTALTFKTEFMAKISSAAYLGVSLYYLSQSFDSRSSGSVTNGQSWTQTTFVPTLGISAAF
jgi:hypothetical protein